MKKYLGVITIILLVLISLFIWYFNASNLPLWTNISIILRTLGRMTGIVGMVLFAINMILSARVKFLEPYFQGLPNLYNKHHLIGAIAFGLILFHPLFLGAQFLSVSIVVAAQFFIPNSKNLPLLGGIIALGIMIISLFITFYIRVTYQRWRFSHQFLGLAFIIASLHMFFIPSDVSNYSSLFWYMLVLVILGVSAFLYRSLFGRFFVKKYSYIVKNVTNKNNSITEIILSPVGQPMPYKAGQFAFVSFRAKNFSSEPHPFSIISKEGDTEIGFAIKKLGDYTNFLNQIPIESSVLLEGAYGEFSQMAKNKNNDQIWISGGIGVTPFISMARSLAINETKHIDLYYCVQSQEEAVYLDIFEEIAKERNTFRVISSYSKEQGYLTAQKIEELSGNLTNKEIYICGPVPMMQILRHQLITIGIPNNQIHSEEFNLL